MDISNGLLDALFSQGRVGVGVCGVDGRLQQFNAALEAMVEPGEIPLVRALAGEVVTDAAITTRRPGQPVRHLRCTAAPLLDGDRAAGALVLVTEATEPAEDAAGTLDAQLERHRERADRLQELSFRVATIANHQIRTPLTVIQAHLELLEDGADDLPEQALRALPAIRRGVTSLTAALTALTRANDLANASDPALEAIDLADVTRRAARLVQAGHPPVRVHLASATRSYVPANADPMWVLRAIVALSDGLVGTDHDTDVVLDVLDEGGTVGVRLSRSGHGSSSAGCLTDSRAAHADSPMSPCSFGLALAEAVALAHDGCVEVAETATGVCVTLRLSRVPEPLPGSIPRPRDTARSGT